MAVHINYNQTNTKDIQVDSQFFMERQSPDVKQWGQQRTNLIYPKISALKSKQKGPANVDMTSALKNLISKQNTTNQSANPGTAATAQPADSTEQNYKKYGMSKGDLNQTLHLCGLQQGQEE
jgi:hypothetical protein